VLFLKVQHFGGNHSIHGSFAFAYFFNYIQKSVGAVFL